ncbi:MAG: bacterioferritin [Candidatus Melainabacteria bacterium]|nr:bacterioferritin [Candidatus Melainabacteria bacterium]
MEKSNEKLIKALNKDLEKEMAGIVRYLHHSFIVFGPNRGPLVQMFRAQATESMTHAIQLGEKITALGGHPTVKVDQVFEPGYQSVEDMLAEDLKAEKQQLQLYTEQLKEFGDYNLTMKLMLEQIIVNEQTHVDEMEKYLRTSNESLVVLDGHSRKG